MKTLVCIDDTDNLESRGTGKLAQLMIDYNLGCTTQQTYELKKIDSDYFGEE